MFVQIALFLSLAFATDVCEQSRTFIANTIKAQTKVDKKTTFAPLLSASTDSLTKFKTPIYTESNGRIWLDPTWTVQTAHAVLFRGSVSKPKPLYFIIVKFVDNCAEMPGFVRYIEKKHGVGKLIPNFGILRSVKKALSFSDDSVINLADEVVREFAFQRRAGIKEVAAVAEWLSPPSRITSMADQLGLEAKSDWEECRKANASVRVLVQNRIGPTVGDYIRDDWEAHKEDPARRARRARAIVVLGMKSLQLLKELHTETGIVHNDAHGDNIAFLHLEAPATETELLNSQLLLIDFGEAALACGEWKPRESDKELARASAWPGQPPSFRNDILRLIESWADEFHPNSFDAPSHKGQDDVVKLRTKLHRFLPDDQYPKGIRYLGICQADFPECSAVAFELEAMLTGARNLPSGAVADYGIFFEKLLEIARLLRVGGIPGFEAETSSSKTCSAVKLALASSAAVDTNKTLTPQLSDNASEVGKLDMESGTSSLKFILRRIRGSIFTATLSKIPGRTFVAKYAHNCEEPDLAESNHVDFLVREFAIGKAVEALRVAPRVYYVSPPAPLPADMDGDSLGKLPNSLFASELMECRAKNAGARFLLQEKVGLSIEKYFLRLQQVDEEVERISVATQALEVARQSVLLLQKIHTVGVVHNDIHEANICLRGDSLEGLDSVVLIDFGFAAIACEQGIPQIHQDYMPLSPWQLENPKSPPSYRDDIFRLIETLARLMSGGDIRKAMRYHLWEDSPPLIDKMQEFLSKDPSKLIDYKTKFNFFQADPRYAYAGCGENQSLAKALDDILNKVRQLPLQMVPSIYTSLIDDFNLLMAAQLTPNADFKTELYGRLAFKGDPPSDVGTIGVHNNLSGPLIAASDSMNDGA